MEDIIPKDNPRRGREKTGSRPPTKRAAGRVQTLASIPERDFRDLRRVNQYDLPRSEGYTDDSFFHTTFQERVYNEVIMTREKPYVIQKHIDFTKLDKDPEYFAEAKAIWEELGLVPLMKFTQDYDPIRVA